MAEGGGEVSVNPPVVEAVREILAFLDRRSIGWAVLGGLAIRVLALPRPTFDVDVIVGVGADQVGVVARAAEDAGFVVDDAYRRGYCDTLAGQSKFHVHASQGARLIRIDLFVLGSEFERSVFERRVQCESDLGALWVVSPEDVLLLKLLADRPRDRADVADLLLVVGTLDMGYVRDWASHLGVTERLRVALAEAGRS